MRYSRRQHHVAGSKPRVSHLAVWGSYVGFFGEYSSRRLRTAAMSREEYMKLRPLRLMPFWSRHFAIMFTGFKSAPARSKSSWSFRQVKNKESGGNVNNQRDRLHSTNPSKVADVELYQVQSGGGVLQWLRSLPLTLKNQPERSQVVPLKNILFYLFSRGGHQTKTYISKSISGFMNHLDLDGEIRIWPTPI